MNQQARTVFSVVLAAASMGAAGPAYAGVSVSGSVTPAVADPGDPWDLGANALLVGSALNAEEPMGEVIVSHQGTLISAGASVAAVPYSSGRVQVIGYGSRWINHGQLALGLRTGASGSLLVKRGAQVTTDDLVLGVRGYSAFGYVLVEGYDASLTSQTNAYIGRSEELSVLEIKQGGSFFSNNVFIATCQICQGDVTVTGSATRWVNTGEFVVGANGGARLRIEQGAQVFTANAQIETYRGEPNYFASSATVRGWDATWTNEGLLRVGAAGYGELTVGAYGTLVTEDTEIRSTYGHGFVRVNEPYASWRNSGDVTIYATFSISPSLLVDGRGEVSIGGLLRITPLFEGGTPGPEPIVRLTRGALAAGAIEIQARDFDFAGGRLSTGSFVGDLANTQAGALSVGEVYASTDVAGDYSQGPSATLSATVAGPGAAPLLVVDGDVSLDGVLEVVPADDTAPFQAGDTVALLGWSGELTGTFADVHIALPLAPGLAWDTSALYTTGEITVVPSA
ncbi:hypothetical protein WMF27_07755 [Sorangium sp. So ce281]|uniref:hypothetical protein n=1 Tax=unclassified Sorangium TaxID=2621164 RepID=UPI003F608C52